VINRWWVNPPRRTGFAFLSEAAYASMRSILEWMEVLLGHMSILPVEISEFIAEEGVIYVFKFYRVKKYQLSSIDAMSNYPDNLENIDNTKHLKKTKLPFTDRAIRAEEFLALPWFRFLCNLPDQILVNVDTQSRTR
jgi:hypothetical protein